MKYCASGRQPISILKKVDEIRVRYEDKDQILDFIENLSNKTVILEIPRGEQVNWELYKAYSNKIDFILCLAELSLAEKCHEYGIKFFWGYQINSYYELRGILKFNPCYIQLGAPLSFDLPKVKNITDIPIRLVANVAYDNYIPREDGVCGQWIRPEDVDLYEEWVAALEFDCDSLQREGILLNIYKDKKQWLGNLNMIITNLDINVDNSTISPEVAKARLSCGQRCMSSGACHICPRALKYKRTSLIELT